MAKTGNHSVRMDEEKMKFFVEKNPKISKPQQIVDFFLDEFWWKHHGKWISEAQIDEMPTNGRQYAEKQINLIHEPKISQYDAFYNEIRNSSSAYQVEIIIKEVKADVSLTVGEKERLRTFGVQTSQKFDF